MIKVFISILFFQLLYQRILLITYSSTIELYEILNKFVTIFRQFDNFVNQRELIVVTKIRKSFQELRNIKIVKMRSLDCFCTRYRDYIVIRIEFFYSVEYLT